MKTNEKAVTATGSIAASARSAIRAVTTWIAAAAAEKDWAACQRLEAELRVLETELASLPILHRKSCVLLVKKHGKS